jgi:hypothetical protein
MGGKIRARNRTDKRGADLIIDFPVPAGRGAVP